MTEERPGEPPEYLMKNVVAPGENDILCGRSKQTHHHPGNLSYRGLVNLNKSFYASCEKSHKGRIAQGIVAAIRAQKPPGRFLVKDSKTSLYNDIGDKKAIEKTSQALREGQPKIREKIHHNMITTENETPVTEVDPTHTTDLTPNIFPPSNIDESATPTPVSTVLVNNSTIPSDYSPSKIDLTSSSDLSSQDRNDLAAAKPTKEDFDAQDLYDSIVGTGDGTESLANNHRNGRRAQKRMSSVTVESMSDLISLDALAALHKSSQSDNSGDVTKSPARINIEQDYDVFTKPMSIEVPHAKSRARDSKKSQNPLDITSSVHFAAKSDLCMSMETIQKSLRSSTYIHPHETSHYDMMQGSLRSSVYNHDVCQDDLMSITTDMRSLNMSTMGESITSADIRYDKKIDYEIDTLVYSEREHELHQEEDDMPSPKSERTAEVQHEVDMEAPDHSDVVLDNPDNRRSALLRSLTDDTGTPWSDFKKSEGYNMNSSSLLSDFSAMTNMTTFNSSKRFDDANHSLTDSFQRQYNLQHQLHINDMQGVHKDPTPQETPSAGHAEDAHHEVDPNVVLHNPQNRRSALLRSISEKEGSKWSDFRKTEGFDEKNTSSVLSEFTAMPDVNEYDAAKDPYI